jgi:phosphoenolpyruvate---glycerone phosphotransferase subunit DhaL
MSNTTVDIKALVDWIRAFATAVSENKQYLTQLDSAIGDADHGANMDRGMTAVVAALDSADQLPATAGVLFKLVGMNLVTTVGGASGPLYGTLFLRMATAAGDASELDTTKQAELLQAGLEGVVARGKAEANDKTMYDALAPACAALRLAAENGRSPREAWAAATDAAEAGAEATIPMRARKGRASYLGERSIGHKDPGACSSALLVRAAAHAFA